MPEVKAGRVLGHEAVGTVTAVGSAVPTLVAGDRVLVSCISACGHCRYCRAGRYGQCRGGGGWILGHLIDGTQAEYVRVPFADTSTYKVPEGVTDEQMVMLADILPTAYEVGATAGVVRPGDVVAIIGAGPIGLAAIMTAQLFSPSHVIVIDPAESRLEAARNFGADVVMEAVGLPETFESAVELPRPGAHVANIGVHGAPAMLHLEDIWAKNLTITTGLVDTCSTPTLIGLVASHRLDTTPMITHRFGLEDFEAAYDTFSRPSQTGALKVLLTRASA